MNITDLWLQLQELEQQVYDAKSEASRSHSVFQAELDLIKTKLNVDCSARNQRLEALIKRVKTLKLIAGTIIDNERRLASGAVGNPTQTVKPSETPSEDTLGGGQV